MNEMQLDALKERLVDWVGLWEFVHRARETLNLQGNELRSAVLASVRELLDGGLMTAGDLGSTSFSSWNTTPEAAMRRIADEWLELGREPNMGDICWFANTENGSEIARQSLRSDELTL